MHRHSQLHGGDGQTYDEKPAVDLCSCGFVEGWKWVDLNIWYIFSMTNLDSPDTLFRYERTPLCTINYRIEVQANLKIRTPLPFYTTNKERAWSYFLIINFESIFYPRYVLTN